MTQLKVKKFIEWVFQVFICYLSVIYLCIHWLLLFVHLLAATEGWSVPEVWLQGFQRPLPLPVVSAAWKRWETETLWLPVCLLLR